MSRFRDLHHADRLLVLPNVWDVVTARVVESAGAPAVATSSAALAWVHGARDGEKLPVPLLLQTVGAIARAIRVPLSVDLDYPERFALIPLGVFDRDLARMVSAQASSKYNQLN